MAMTERRKPLYSSPWHLVSFPRSGSHLVRGLLEAASGRKTLGCPGAKNDKPIYKRSENKRRKIIDVDALKPPIALKSHFSTEIWRYSRKFPKAGLILITRNPVDAISSHLLREIDSEEKLALRDYGREIEHLQRAYLHLLYAYEGYPEDLRYRIKFEELTGSQQDTSRILAEIDKKMNAGFTQLSDQKISEIRALTKDGLFSLGNVNPVVKAIVRKAIQLRITNAEVERFLV